LLLVLWMRVVEGSVSLCFLVEIESEVLKLYLYGT